MSGPYDLIVLGAGPAGAAAALAATRVGVRPLLIDDAPAAGGQVYRAPAPGIRPRDPKAADLMAGAELRQALAASPVTTAFGNRVWNVAAGFEVATVGADGPRRHQAPAVIVASGTSERVIPMPGVTLPGVVGLAGATILLKAQQMLPGEATVVAGVGPLLATVAASILSGGGRVVAVVDLAAPDEWLRVLPGLARRPDLLARGLGWIGRITRARVPVLFRHAVSAVQGGDRVEAVAVRRVGPDGALAPGAPRILEADALAIGHGLVPAIEVTRLLGAAHAFRPDLGGWIAERDPDLRTSIEGLYVAGDAGGITGAAAASLEGQLAGLTAAFDLGRIDRARHQAESAPVRAQLARAERFGGAMSRMMALRPGLVGSMPASTIVCRCEDLSREAIDQAVAAGCRDLNQLKSSTRCGMGPCQGRMCGEAAAELVAQGAGVSRERVGFDYEDIPRPAPAPA